jgi:hypothetical protein
MGVIDWRAWTAQNSAGTGGGTMPGTANPPGQIPGSQGPYTTGVVFPGVGPITDTVSGATSIPSYPNVPTYVPAVDPFGGWVDQKELVANSAGAQVPTMRPTIPGLTS